MTKEKTGMMMLYLLITGLVSTVIALVFLIDFLLGVFLFCVIGWAAIAIYLIW